MCDRDLIKFLLYRIFLRLLINTFPASPKYFVTQSATHPAAPKIFGTHTCINKSFINYPGLSDTTESYVEGQMILWGPSPPLMVRGGVGSPHPPFLILPGREHTIIYRNDGSELFKAEVILEFLKAIVLDTLL